MMKNPFIVITLLFVSTTSFSQNRLNKLSVEKIMRAPSWIGTSPSSLNWSKDGRRLYFQWNPDSNPADSLYYITPTNFTPVKVSVAEKMDILYNDNLVYNADRSAFLYTQNGDIIFTETKSGKAKTILQTTERESNPRFSFNDSKVVYTQNQNLFAWDIASGEIIQLTNLKEKSNTPQPQSSRQTNNLSSGANKNQEEEWLMNDQLQYFQVLRERKEKREASSAYNKSLPKEKELRTISIGDARLQGLTISPDGRFISYRLYKAANNPKSTIVPNYVTETGFTTDIPARTKVGAPQGISSFFIYDKTRDSIFSLLTDSIPGIKDLPDYVKDYPKELKEQSKKAANRSVTVYNMEWSPKGTNVVLDIYSDDNKDRWLMLWDTSTRHLKLLDRQRDEAWIGGPGIGYGSRTGWIDENTFWFQSEATGYSHLYTINVLSGEKNALTSGNFEVQQAQLSLNKKYFYITTNEVHPGEQQFYRLSIADGKKERITTMTGANQVTLSPDEKWLGILYSYSNKPWELYLQENIPVGKKAKPTTAIQITHKAESEEFKSYNWKDPEVITFPARDGALVYARLYKPANPDPHKPAVLFVHGAGYLQNAHKWWSSYFREYMFNNMLADNGYYVMDIDYRGSAGYGRNWRTGIYRHMGGKDLDDNTDAANYLVNKFGVDPKRIGLYGGSYGGFITLMAMFNEPGVFAAGAALRPVTDWANYNHGYTSNILNEPYTDSLAYRRSSPYYFANGLKGHLLICHGMVDVNVHFQDAVKLTQRLIELGKDNWELAPYPMEDHGFVEPSSWTDEYKRIYKLFETVLKK